LPMTIDHKIDPPPPAPAITTVTLTRCGVDARRDESDAVATEEPLEVRLGFHLLGKPAQRSLAVTMRTPGSDFDLARGFLFGEGIVDDPHDIETIEVVDTNILRVTVAPEVTVDMASVQRNFYTTSSCGVCGKASLEALEVDEDPLTIDDMRLSASLIASLPDRLRTRQSLFDATGGIHAAGLFDVNGQLLDLREDVGRHNAMDKLVGAQLAKGALPLEGSVVVWSGRASFELVQKAVRAKIPVIVAVGAPSSLAVELARTFGLTLIGFARHNRFNIYSHPERIYSESVTHD
jgi:FdhD protein